jgi:RHS repeat-associated protein
MTAFGQPVASTGSSTDPYEFGATSGYRSDGDGASELPSGGSDGDGLVKVGCRYYDPATGSFVSRDTELDQAPYVYCDGDPVNAVDPSGYFDTNSFENGLIVGVLVGVALVAAPEVGIIVIIGAGLGAGGVAGAITGSQDGAGTVQGFESGAVGGVLGVLVGRYLIRRPPVSPPSPPPPPPENDPTTWPPPPMRP